VLYRTSGLESTLVEQQELYVGEGGPVVPGVDAAGAGEAFGSTIASEPPLTAVATIDVVGSGKQGAVFVYSLGGSGPTWSLTHTITPPPALAVRYTAWVCRWCEFVHSRACIVTHDLLRGAVRGCSDASAGVWSVVGLR